MTLSAENKPFCVYKHTSPDGKVYIGITSQPVSARWGVGGREYKSNSHLWSAIQLYGWDNFKHQIVASGLSKSDACQLEIYLIAKYDSTDPDKGYNHTSGGDWNYPSPEVRHKLKLRTTENWKDPEFRKKVICGLQGHTVSEDTRRKISISNKGKPGPNHPWKGKSRPKEYASKYLGHTPWNKGLSKNTSSKVAAYSYKLSGRIRTDTHIQHLKTARKQQYIDGYSPIWINNGCIETTIDASCQSIPAGFVRGRLHRATKYMYKGDISKKILVDQVSEFLQDGWKLGRGPSVGKSIRSSRNCYVYFVDNIKFNTSIEAADYLRTHGYCKISASTIENISKHTLPARSKYSELIGRVCREEVVAHENSKD